MKLSKLITIAFLSFGVLSCDSKYDLSPKSTATSNVSVQEDLTKQVNEYRKSVGVNELGAPHKGLSELCEQHNHFLANNKGKFDLYGNNVSHYGAEGRIMTAHSKYGLPTTAEIVSWGARLGDKQAFHILSGWKKSPTHNWALCQNWDTYGISVLETKDGEYYSTLIFGSYNSDRNKSYFQTLDQQYKNQ